jgi:hypothetical protein
MLDPRIYRMGLIAVVFGVIVFAFSLQQQRDSLQATLTPDAFNGQTAAAATLNISSHFPRRSAGSANDAAIAAEIAQDLRRGDGFTVSTPTFTAPTASGTRTLENVIGVRSGLANGTIVVVAPRDATGSPAAAAESGTGVLLELGNVLSGETLNHTIALVSTTGSVGATGMKALIDELPSPVDAVLVLGDMSGTSMHEPIVVPWSTGQELAPPLLRNTAAAALSSQTGLSAGAPTLVGDFMHLAFPFTVSGQGPLNAAGIPAVLLSSSGELAPANKEVPNPGEIAQFGRTALQTITALDGGSGQVPAPSAYLQLSGNVIPAWALRLLVLTLILPVLVTTVDGFARVRRRKHAVGPWLVWLLACSAPFVLAAAIVVLCEKAGLISGIATVIVLPLVVIRRANLLRPAASRQPEGGNPGGAAALLVLMCVLSLAVWFANPFAAALMIPALHAWMWAVAPEVRMHRAWRLALVLVGLAPPVLVVAYYMISLSFNPITLAWSVVLMLAGGDIGLLRALEWCLALGSAVGVFAIAAWKVRRVPVHEEVPVTVRGPVTYAGPGSLGGTDSALDRRPPALRR